MTTEVAHFYNVLHQIARRGDKKHIRANAKNAAETFREAANPSDVTLVQCRLTAEVRGPQSIAPTSQFEDEIRWREAAGGALEGLGCPP